MSAIGNKEIFARNLSRYLQKSGRSQREMADIVGVSSSTFNEWMRAKKYPRIDKIEFMANFFGINENNEENNNSPSEENLTEGERELLTLFRQIPEDRQPVVLAIIRAALSNGK